MIAKMRYREHNSREVLLNPLYGLHVQAMTAEDLYGKGEIAEELAWRDMEIERLRKIEAAAKNLIAQKDWSKVDAYKMLEESLK